MKITKNGTVYQLAFMPRMFPVNVYLVEEDNGLTLIDAALPYSVKGILAAAREIGKPITSIVLTHAHGDHVGALDALKEGELRQVPVFISKRDSRLLAGDRTLDPGEPDTPIRGGVPKHVNTRADILLSHGDRIGSLRAVASPGHTPGSMAYYDERNGALIAGDALQTRAGVAVSGQVKIGFPFPAMATWHKETALASARALLELKPALLAVGHGKMVDMPIEAMKRAIHEAEQNLAKR
jgi:glyoxylase-like metal-dependent hydrolase (beta-lactamase superfamily II)